MEIKPGLSALITGGASGIGKGLALALAEKGVFITIVDFSEERGRQVASLVEKINTKFHSKLGFPSAIFVKCDVTNARDLAAAFETHLLTYGGLDICINSAGISSSIPFQKDQTDGTQTWRHTINVNFTAVIDSTRLAIKIMEASKRPGVIINLGSASGLYPVADTIYSGSKGGVVMFSRALRLYKREGIRVNVLCPEFVETEMTLKIDSNMVKLTGGFISMEMVVKGAFELIMDESKAGHCLWITNRRGMEYWPSPSEEAKYLIRRFRRRSDFKAPSIKPPESFEKIVVHTLTHNFRNATSVVRTSLRLPIKPKHVLVKIIYAGVNASDVNFSSGHYFGGNNNDTASRLPFDAGFEAVGIIAAVGGSVTDLKIGMPCAFMTFGGYAEFIMIPSKHALPVPRPDPEVVAMLTSGLTASIAQEKSFRLYTEKAGQMESGKVVLVTAAAGGTGQFAVQLAKLAGNTVVATCGGGAKAKLLKELGVDRVIDYHSEDVKTVLREEFPKGIDIIYESVGGDMLNLCLNALAVHGRLIVIGMISQYQGEKGWTPSKYPGLLEKLLAKSQTVSGFFLVQYGHLWQEHLDGLFNLYSTGKLKVAIDPKKFIGLHSAADAVEYLHSGKSVGKVVVSVDPSFLPQVAKL
ncbi:probable quinone oxidoreductase isoform X1 [Glycine soja]|uniref:probable quinone oxidoreductase isoform X1 n=1 Tax=Glycine soja TaxID=3848 RepID=UPI001038A8CC|nr:probable quinone oxidoreductase isoform X1 [Glycine soja]